MANRDILRLTGKLNAINDVYPGGGDSPGLASGQVGKTIRLTNAQALAVSDTSVGTLYAGEYMYVGTYASASASPAVGQGAFWRLAASYESSEVTSDGGATLCGRLAGVFINAITKGRYGFVQVAGEATVLCKSSVADTTDGNACVVDGTTNKFDGPADATGTLTYLLVKAIVGTFLEAPANSGLKKVLLKGLGRNF